MAAGRERRDRPLTVFAFDPSLGRRFGNHLTLRLPYEPLGKGPVGKLVAVVEPGDEGVRPTKAGESRYPAIDLEEPALLLAAGVTPSEFDVRFHQQMVYAVATHTIELFQNSLGRPIRWPWATGTRGLEDRLRLIPHSREEANASFELDEGAIHFGYFSPTGGTGPPGQRVYTCLAFDVVMHTVVHALLAAMGRPEAEVATDPAEQMTAKSFVEGLADLLPLLHHFTLQDAVLETIRRSNGRIHDKMFLPDLLSTAEQPEIQAEVAAPNPLLALAPQFGEALGLGSAIRTALESRPGSQDLDAMTDAHQRGSILVAAVFDALFTVYSQRSADLLRLAGPGATDTGLHPDLAQRLAREAVKCARRFLVTCVRAIDYCPPGPVDFGDYLRAMVTVSSDFAPEREADHRVALIDAFRARGILPGAARSFSEDGVRWPTVPRQATGGQLCRDLRFDQRTPAEHRANQKALAAFLTSHRAVLGLDPGRPVQVDYLPTYLSERLSANGAVLREAVAMVRQPGLRGPNAVEGLRATVVIDEYGSARYVIPNAEPARHDDPLTEPRPADMPTVRPLVIYAFDPSQGQRFGNMLTCQVPYEPLSPGPVGEQLAVIDYDAPNDRYYVPADLDDATVLDGGFELRDDDPRFHQQMVYAVASETIRRFEFALGRRITWPWARRNRKDPVRNRLRILPHAFQEPNAYYDREIGALLFGYFLTQPGDEVVFTCLSHDIVAHETTHALVDAVRPLLLAATGPDALAFHEAFADIVALLQHFSFRDALYETVLRTGGRIHAATLDPEVALRDASPNIQAELTPTNPLVEVAKQFGEAMGTRKALRQAIGTPPDSNRLDTVVEPHERGSILVAAVFDAFFSVYVRRTADLLRLARAGRGVSRWGDLHPDLALRLTREAAKAARHFLTMCVRALDYLPPVDVTFGDFLRAILTSDADLVPDDPWKYRAALIDAFRSRGIRTDGQSGTSEAALRWPLVEDELWIEGPPGGSPFRGTQREVAIRLHGFAEAHRDRLDLDPDPAVPVQAQRFRPQSSRRVDPTSGLRQQEYLAQFVQKREAHVDPDDPSSPTFTFRGGSTVLFFADGRVRYVMSRPFYDRSRLDRQREYQRHVQMNLAAAPFTSMDVEPTLARLHRGW